MFSEISQTDREDARLSKGFGEISLRIEEGYAKELGTSKLGEWVVQAPSECPEELKLKYPHQVA